MNPDALEHERQNPQNTGDRDERADGDCQVAREETHDLGRCRRNGRIDCRTRCRGEARCNRHDCRGRRKHRVAKETLHFLTPFPKIDDTMSGRGTQP